MGKAGKIRKRRRAALLTSVPPMVPCPKTRDAIHRDQPDAEKCQQCEHHHCRACGMCARCRRYGDQRCLRANEEKYPVEVSNRPKGAPWWRRNRQALTAPTDARAAGPGDGVGVDGE